MAAFSSSRRSAFCASFLFLTKKNTSPITTPTIQIIPIANPAFPPALIPPLDAAGVAELDVASDRDAVGEAVSISSGVVEDATTRGPPSPRVDEGGTMEEGRPVDLEDEVACLVVAASAGFEVVGA